MGQRLLDAVLPEVLSGGPPPRAIPANGTGGQQDLRHRRWLVGAAFCAAVGVAVTLGSGPRSTDLVRPAGGPVQVGASGGLPAHTHDALKNSSVENQRFTRKSGG